MINDSDLYDLHYSVNDAKSFIKYTGSNTGRLKTHFKRFINDAITAVAGDFTTMERLYCERHIYKGYEMDAGSWKNPNKQFSGDFALVNDGSAFDLTNRWLLGVVGDGATMLLNPDELSEPVRDLYTNNGLFIPDHFWATMMGIGYFGSSVPTPDDSKLVEIIERFSQDERFYTADAVVETIQPRFINSIPSSPSEIPETVIRRSSKILRAVTSDLLGSEFVTDSSRAGQLASGVMGVVLINPRSNTAYAAKCGDISIFPVDENGIARIMTSEKVTAHDNALDVVGRQKRDFVANTAVSRIRDVGNITGNDLDSTIVVNSYQFIIPVGGGVVVLTDGQLMRWCRNELAEGRQVRVPTPNNTLYAYYNLSNPLNIGATLCFRDPLFYQMDLIREQRRWVKRRADKVYGKNIPEVGWRPDDASYLVIRRTK